MAQRSPNEILLNDYNIKTHNYNPVSKTFIKREIPFQERNLRADGSRKDDPRLAHRFFNEAAALQLLGEKTIIPVPRVISHGYDVNGHLYLETELIEGAGRSSLAASICRRPDSHSTPPHWGFCHACDDIVRKNVDDFVKTIVLPEIRNLKSQSTGLNGYVMPPASVVEEDKRPYWPVKWSKTDEYVFTLHDLVDHKILVDLETLEVRAVIDVDAAGFFPSEMQQWRYDWNHCLCIDRDTEVIRRHIELLA